MIVRRTTLGLAAVLLLAACRGATQRPDDPLEPNDTRANAVVLLPGVPVAARANEGNPDVFAVDLGPGQRLAFVLRHRGLEDCAAFEVAGPKGVLYADTNPTCGRRSAYPPNVAAGASLEQPADGAYRLTIAASEAGRYYLTIRELGEADNVFAFGWDYELTALVE